MTFLNAFFKFFNFKKKLERECVIKKHAHSTYLCIHWLILEYARTVDRTHNLGVLGQCSNQLSYPARARMTFDTSSIFLPFMEYYWIGQKVRLFSIKWL